MSQIVRRSRMRRSRTGKRIELTPRDLEIFRTLARYRYLRSTYLHAFAGGASQTRFKERLGDLFHEGYLDRPERQWELASCRHQPVVHEIGAGAKRVLAEQGIVEEPGTWLGAAPHRQFSHSLMICDVLASIELGSRTQPGLRLIPWPEMLSKAPAETRALVAPYSLRTSASTDAIVPDGLFGIEYADGERKAYRFFALEADRGTMPVVRSDGNQTSYLRKLTTYRDIISKDVHKSQLRVPNLLVLTVTTSRQRLNQIMARFQEQAGGATAFLFKAIDASELAVPAPRFLLQPWERAGLPPLRIDQ